MDIHSAHARLVELIRRAKNDSGPVLARRAAAGIADERQTSLF